MAESLEVEEVAAEDESSLPIPPDDALPTALPLEKPAPCPREVVDDPFAPPEFADEEAGGFSGVFSVFGVMFESLLVCVLSRDSSTWSGEERSARPVGIQRRKRIADGSPREWATAVSGQVQRLPLPTPPSASFDPTPSAFASDDFT